MFKKLVKKIIDFPYQYSALKSDARQMNKDIFWAQQENACLQYLLNLLGPGNYLPHTEMAMSPITICHILNEIIINKRSSIIEFGAGNSTIYIAKIIKSFGLRVKFYSVDSNEGWINCVTENLVALCVQDAVELIYAPVKETSGYASVLASSYKWFDSDVIRKKIDSEKFDLIIVDGPTGKLCPFSRYPAIPFLLHNFAESYTIFLDDAGRTDEAQILNEWVGITGQKIAEINKRYGCISKNTGFITKP